MGGGAEKNLAVKAGRFGGHGNTGGVAMGEEILGTSAGGGALIKFVLPYFVSVIAISMEGSTRDF